MDAVRTQNDRLRRAGYAQQLVDSVERLLIKKFKGLAESRSFIKSRKPAVVPYIHRVGRNLKKAAGRRDVTPVQSRKGGHT